MTLYKIHFPLLIVPLSTHHLLPIVPNISLIAFAVSQINALYYQFLIYDPRKALLHLIKITKNYKLLTLAYICAASSIICFKSNGSLKMSSGFLVKIVEITDNNSTIICRYSGCCI